MKSKELIQKIIINQDLIDLSPYLIYRDEIKAIGVDLIAYDTTFDDIQTIIKYNKNDKLIGISLGGDNLKIPFSMLKNNLGKPRLAYNWRDNYTLFLFDNDRIEIEVVGSVEIIDKKIIITDSYGNSKSYDIDEFYFDSIKLNL